jgi:hypothetical protein
MTQLGQGLTQMGQTALAGVKRRFYQTMAAKLMLKE